MPLLQKTIWYGGLNLACLFMILAAGCGGNGSSNAKTTNPVVVTLSPSTASVVTSNTVQFTAAVTGTKNTKVTWTTTAGTISDTGLFTAPAQVPDPATVTVTATSVANTTYAAAAQVTIQPGASAISVTLSPAAGTVANFGKLQFTATVTGDSNTAVTWYVNGIQGGSQSTGYISASGIFQAPGGVPTTISGNTTKGTTAAISAVLNDNHTYSATANVVIQPANQLSQSLPIELGTSGGNVNDSSVDNTLTTCCGGTLGALLSIGNSQYILSTNHTLARSDSANLGDSIVQPGLLDANCDSARVTPVANLTKFFSFKNSQTANLDAAIAQAVLGAVDTTGKILYLGDTLTSDNVPAAAPPHAGSGLAANATLLGRPVAKSGRTTGLTCSTVDSVAVSLTVEYVQNCDGTGAPINVQYSGQIEVEGNAFSAQGDSGALVVSQDTSDAVGLLFASSDSASVANPISDVLNYFKDSNGNPASIVGAAAHSVIGCTMPVAISSATSSSQKAVAMGEVEKANRVRDSHIAEILSHPQIRAVTVEQSLDNPAEAAIVLLIGKHQKSFDLPQQIDGVRTRIVEVAGTSAEEALSEFASAAKKQSLTTSVSALADSEFQRAKVVHTTHVAELLKKAGVQGVGISPSLDSPGEAALLVFLVRAIPHDEIPTVIDGVRTRVRESSRFRANYGGTSSPRSCHLSQKR